MFNFVTLEDSGRLSPRPKRTAYLISKLSNKKRRKNHLMVFKVIYQRGNKLTFRFVAIYVTLDKEIDIKTQIISKNKKQILKFFGLKEEQLSMGHKCLFSGDDVFGEAISLKGCF